MISFKEFINEGFNVDDKHINRESNNPVIYKYRKRFVIDTEHAVDRYIGRIMLPEDEDEKKGALKIIKEKHLKPLTEQDMIIIFKRMMDYVLDRRDLASKDGKFLFFSESYQQGIVTLFEEGRNQHKRLIGNKRQFINVTYLPRTDNHLPPKEVELKRHGKVSKRAMIENKIKEIYGAEIDLSDCKCVEIL